MSYTVKQIAKLAGVSARTLHYYDEIGLLKPASLGENGYRYYNEDSLLRLQQILIFRELDLPLEQIKRIMGRRDFDVITALRGHKQDLRKRIVLMERLISTVERTIRHLQGEEEMSEQELFEGFSEEQQAEYEKEAMQMYDPETVKASNARWRAFSAAEKQRIFDEGNAVYQSFIQAMPQGHASPQAQSAVEAWRRHMDYFWTPAVDQLLLLAQGYVDEPRFRANFDKMHPALAEFIRDAVKVYVQGK